MQYWRSISSISDKPINSNLNLTENQSVFEPLWILSHKSSQVGVEGEVELRVQREGGARVLQKGPTMNISVQTEILRVGPKQKKGSTPPSGGGEEGQEPYHQTSQV